MNEEILRQMIREVLITEKLKSVYDTGRAPDRQTASTSTSRRESTGDVKINKDNIGNGPSDSSGIRSGVKTTDAILSAWNWLRPFLPSGAIMTSGERSQSDQDRTIRNYADRENITYSDLDDAVEKLREKGFVIARHVSTGGGRGHGTGLAFDISGARLEDIKKSIEFATNNGSIHVKFNPFGSGDDPSIVEETNNAVHAVIKSVQVYSNRDMVAFVDSATGADTATA
jgi:hypothetical protein